MPPLELRARRRRAARQRGEAAETPGTIDLAAAAPRTARRGGPLRLDARTRDPGRRGRDRHLLRTHAPAGRRSRLVRDPARRAGSRPAARPSHAPRRPLDTRDPGSAPVRPRRRSDRRRRGIVAASASSHPWSRAVPGIRVPGAADPHEMLVRAMIGQQITVVRGAHGADRSRRARWARTSMTSAAPACCSRAWPRSPAAVTRCFADRRRARARSSVPPTALADGTLHLGAGDDGQEQRAALLAMPGIGPWTADYVRMRVTGDPDVFLPGDVAVRAGAAAAGHPCGCVAAHRMGRPRRALALVPDRAPLAAVPPRRVPIPGAPGGRESRSRGNPRGERDQRRRRSCVRYTGTRTDTHQETA